MIIYLLSYSGNFIFDRIRFCFQVDRVLTDCSMFLLTKDSLFIYNFSFHIKQLQAYQRGRTNLEQFLLFSLNRRKRGWSRLQPYPRGARHQYETGQERLTASFKKELNALNNSAANNQFKEFWCISILHHFAQKQIIQQFLETDVITPAEEITGRCSTRFVSAAVPVDARVSAQIERKPWSNKFIEFRSHLAKEKQKKVFSAS